MTARPASAPSFTRLACAWMLGLVLACGGGGHNTTAPATYPFTNIPAPAGGVALFSVVPITPGPGLSLTALGNLNPPGHVVPTDHVYFYPLDLSGVNRTPITTARDVVMPTTGAVTFLLQQSSTEVKIEFRVTENFFFYFDHLVLSQPLKVGDIVTVGTTIGYTAPGVTLDLGAFDMNVTNTGFLVPARYSLESLHAVSPWKYFAPSLQPALYAQMYRAPGAPLDGRIDFDVAGKLVGNWYQDGLAADQSSSGPAGWPRTIAFVYDYYDPSKVRISIGGTIGPAGVWAIDSTVPRPADVSVASGLVAYKLYSPFDVQPPYGVLLVQMISDTQIKVELFVGSTAQTAFDGGAFTFVR